MDIRMAKLREKLRDLTLFDDELMTLAFHGDCEFTEFLLNAICPHAGFKVTQVRTQQTLSNIMGRSLKLDILADDVLGRKVNIEVQNLASGAGPVRARFHSSLLDAHLLDKGMDFKALPTTFIIFITKTDVLGGGIPVYTVERHIHELQMPFDDKNFIIYVNGACMEDTLLGRIMHDFQCRTTDQMKCQTVADKVQNIKEIKEEKKMGALYDFFYEEVYDEIYDKGLMKGREEGLEKGRTEGLEKGRDEGARSNCAHNIHKYMTKHGATLEEALALFEVPDKDVETVVSLVCEIFGRQTLASMQLIKQNNS